MKAERYFKKGQFKRGQFFSVDAIFAVVIFIAILISIYSYWDYSSETARSYKQRSELEVISRNAFGVLVSTEGIPSNWSMMNETNFNAANVKSLGLSRGASLGRKDTINKNKAGAWNTGHANLDSSKIQQLEILNVSKYDGIKDMLGFSGNSDFELDIYRWNGSSYKLNSTIGTKVEQNSTNIVSLHRYALLNSTWIYLNFRGWERCAQSC